MKKNLIFGGFLAVFAFSLAYAFVGILDYGMTEAEIMTYVKEGKMSVAQAEKLGVYVGSDYGADPDGSEIMRLFENVKD